MRPLAVILFPLVMAAFTSPPWPSDTYRRGQRTDETNIWAYKDDRVWQTYSAIVERASALALPEYDAPRWYRFERDELVRAKQWIAENATRFALPPSVVTNWYVAFDGTNDPLPVWTVTGLLAHVSAPTQYLDRTPYRDLATATNGWRFITNIFAVLTSVATDDAGYRGEWEDGKHGGYAETPGEFMYGIDAMLSDADWEWLRTASPCDNYESDTTTSTQEFMADEFAFGGAEIEGLYIGVSAEFSTFPQTALDGSMLLVRYSADAAARFVDAPQYYVSSNAGIASVTWWDFPKPLVGYGEEFMPASVAAAWASNQIGQARVQVASAPSWFGGSASYATAQAVDYLCRGYNEAYWGAGDGDDGIPGDSASHSRTGRAWYVERDRPIHAIITYDFAYR